MLFLLLWMHVLAFLVQRTPQVFQTKAERNGGRGLGLGRWRRTSLHMGGLTERVHVMCRWVGV